jgi:hypothetical protein
VNIIRQKIVNTVPVVAWSVEGDVGFHSVDLGFRMSRLEINSCDMGFVLDSFVYVPPLDDIFIWGGYYYIC